MVAIHAATITTVAHLPVLPDTAQSLTPLCSAISVAAVIALLLIVWTKGRLGYNADTAPGDFLP